MKKECCELGLEQAEEFVETVKRVEDENKRLKEAIRSMLLAGSAQSERIAIHHAKRLLEELA